MLGLAASLLVGQGEVWRHLAETQLGDIIANSLVLLLGVGIGTTIVGAGTAWLVTACRFAGSRTFEWGLMLPLVLPTYIIGYAYADLLAYAGPLQSGAARDHRLDARRLLVPRDHFGRRRRCTLHVGPLSLRLSRRACRLPVAVAGPARSQPRPRPRPVADLPADCPAARHAPPSPRA